MKMLLPPLLLWALMFTPTCTAETEYTEGSDEIEKQIDLRTRHGTDQMTDQPGEFIAPGAIISGIFTGMKLVNTLLGVILGGKPKDSLDEIKNTLSQIEQKVDDLSKDVRQVLRGQEHLGNVVRYNDAVNRLEFLLHYFEREIRLENDVFVPADAASSWAEEVVSLSSDGMDQVLLSMHSMVLGSAWADSMFITYESLLDRHASAYLPAFQHFGNYTLCLQASGYALWVNALIILNRDPEYPKDFMLDRYSEQNEFLAAVGATWPAGEWGLRKTPRGCPARHDFPWYEGNKVRPHHDTRYSENFPWVTIPIQSIFFHTIDNFCMKYSGGTGEWPQGDYCIYVAGDGCPTGFSCGYIRENLRFSSWTEGAVPKGSSNKVPEYYFACRSDGSANEEMVLPASTPFFLIRFHGNCQPVKFMTVWQYWDYHADGGTVTKYAAHPLDDFGGGGGLQQYVCYYRPALFAYDE